MPAERLRQIILGVIVVVLVGVIARVSGIWPGTSAASSPPTEGAERTNAARPPQASTSAAPPAVHLDALNSDRPKPEAAERNLFRFKPKAPPPPPPDPVRPAQPLAPVNTAPTGPPPPPPLAPITLKFIGVVEATTQGEKIAILSDGKNAPFYGKEGAIIEGRYRILKIGVESVELAYADGRGRQTIRLTGS